jgi:hypothetical protein
VADVAELLGQPAAAERLARLLEHPDTRVVRLTGPAGSGKSHIANLVAADWVNQRRVCVIAVGDEEHSSRELYPLLMGLSRAHASRGQLVRTGARSALQVADRALVGASIGTTIFDLLSAAFRQRIERALKAYSSLERDVILDLKRLARSRKLLLVADNAHWWDADSLRLIHDVVSDVLHDAIPQLASVVVLLVDTSDEQRVVAPEAFSSLASLAAEPTERTARCTPEQFSAVLSAFGMTDSLPDDILHALFIATHGHLKLAEQVAAYAQHSSLQALADSSGGHYLTRLVSARLASLGSSSPEISDLLIRAAVLGLTFSEHELLCISDAKRAALRELIRNAEGIGFIERDGDQISFSHDVIRSAILSDRPPEQFDELHAKLSDCLAILRPGDYATRAQADRQAGDAARAREMLALACISQLRRGVPPSRALARGLLELPEDRALKDYLTRIADGYAAVGAGDFAGPIPALRTPLHGESKLMAAERNYLAALCSMELQTADGFAEAVAMLTSWLPSLDGEVELRLRFLMLLQQAQVLSELLEEARETESKIEQQLLDRVPYDPDAAIALQIQNRRASAVNGPTVAEQRIREAVTFFRAGSRPTSREQLELYRSLNNLIATQIRLGKFAEAHANAEDAERIALDNPDVVRRLDCLASNAVLAGLRLGVIDVTEAIIRQQMIITSPEGAADKFLHRCNLAAFLLLAARDGEADAELQRLGDELRSQSIAETYLYFYWAASSAGLAAVRGELQEALRLHAEMEHFSQAIRWPCAAHVRRRQLLLPELLPLITADTPREAADRILLDTHPNEVGPGWDYYARLFPCAELSYWSDS